MLLSNARASAGRILKLHSRVTRRVFLAENGYWFESKRVYPRTETAVGVIERLTYENLVSRAENARVYAGCLPRARVRGRLLASDHHPPSTGRDELLVMMHRTLEGIPRRSRFNNGSPELKSWVCSGELRYREQTCAYGGGAWKFGHVDAKTRDSDQMAC